MFECPQIQEEVHTQPDSTEGKLSHEAINALVINHERLIWKEVIRFQGTHALTHDLSKEDLFQAGVIGAIKAAKKFEPERGNKFSTFAFHDIKKSIRTSIIEGGRNIRVPADAFTQCGRIAACEGKMGKKLTIQELHEMTGICRATLKNVREYTKIRMKPIDGKKEDNNGDPLFALSETIPDEKSPNPEEEAIVNERIAIARAIMAELKREDPKAGEVLKMRFGFENDVEMNNEEIGKKLGATREGIRQIGKRGLEKLKPFYRRIVSGSIQTH